MLSDEVRISLHELRVIRIITTWTNSCGCDIKVHWTMMSQEIWAHSVTNTTTTITVSYKITYLLRLVLCKHYARIIDRVCNQTFSAI